MKRIVSIGLLMVGTICVTAFGNAAEMPDDDESAIRNTGEAYVRAFNTRDAKALAAFWLPEAL